MLTQRISYSQAASVVTANVLAGTGVEYMGRASLLDLYGAAFLAGANDTVGMSYTVGGDSRVMLPAGSGLNVNAAGPQVAFDGLLDEYPLPLGARLVMQLTSDATAGTHAGRFMLVVKP
jgi:hypothetical protein